MSAMISESASVSNLAKLGNKSSIWDFAQVRENASIGKNTVVGSYVYIDANVVIGNDCKIQNRALIYDPAVIHNGVFIGPGVILTNDKNPRAVLATGGVKGPNDWVKVGVEVLEGASIGSGAVCVAPIKIGKWALVGAGSVVTKDVKDFALVAGNPAIQLGWVGRAGIKLLEIEKNEFQCPVSLTRYTLKDSQLSERIAE